MCPVLPPFLSFWWLCLFCLQWSFFLIYRFPVIFLVLPFVSPWFRSFSSPTSSSSSVPCRRVLLVCPQLRLHRRLGILLPCPLLWLLPLRLPSGFRLLLTFSGAVLLLAGFRWGLVVPARRVFSSFYLFNLSSMMVPSLTAGSEYRSKGGGGCCSLFVASSPDYFVEGFRGWHLMPSGLLVWQIPYREMLSLGLKVSIRHGSRLPCLCCVVYGGPCRP